MSDCVFIYCYLVMLVWNSSAIHFCECFKVSSTCLSATQKYLSTLSLYFVQNLVWLLQTQFNFLVYQINLSQRTETGERADHQFLLCTGLDNTEIALHQKSLFVRMGGNKEREIYYIQAFLWLICSGNIHSKQRLEERNIREAKSCSHFPPSGYRALASWMMISQIYIQLTIF